MGYYILIFELAIIVLYGIFLRTGYTTTSSFSDLEAPLYFTLAFTLLHFKYRMYDWSQLTNLLFVAAITFQLNTLLFIFWESSFYRTFNSTSNISPLHLIINIECALTILVTLFQFVGRFTPQQIFALSIVQIFAFALSFSINQLGLKAITAGGTMNIFLFGYVFALPIKFFCCKEEIQNKQEERYFTLTLKFIGLVACILLWPNFAYTTALVDEYYLITSIGSLQSTAYLAAQSFLHMIIGFCAAIGTTIGLRIYGQKVVLQKFINTLLMTGIFLSSSAAVIIDPFASLLMGAFAPILAFLLQKFIPDLLNKGYPLQGIIFSVLGGIFNSIFTAGRNGRTPSLCDNPLQQGGFQFLSVLISAALGLLFGLLAAVILRCFNPRQSINKDRDAWFIDQQSLPIYPDDQILRKITGGDVKEMRQEDVMFNLKNAYLTEKAKNNRDTGTIVNQIVEGSRIR